MELIRADLLMILDIFNQLEILAAIDGVHDAEIRIKNECGDTIVVGYGENGDPAVLDVELPEDLMTYPPPQIPYIQPIPIPMPSYPAPNTPWITWNDSNTGNPPPDSGHRNQCAQSLDGTDADYNQLYGNRY